MGKLPDYDLVVAVEYQVKGERKTHFHNIGVAWKAKRGPITINMVTMPGVKLILIPKNREEADAS